MDESLIVILFVASVVLFIIGIIVWTLGRSRNMLEEWADRNGHTILDAHICWFRKGPFLWTSSKNQHVYRVTMVDAKGRTREGWIRCGSFWLGLWSKRVDVRWDDGESH